MSRASEDRRLRAAQGWALGEPEVEVVAKAGRRRFTVAYKRKIVREADGCEIPGAVWALLRREGLYFSHLSVRREDSAEFFPRLLECGQGLRLPRRAFLVQSVLASPRDPWVVSSASGRICLSKEAVHEYFGLAVYRVRGWI